MYTEFLSKRNKATLLEDTNPLGRVRIPDKLLLSAAKATTVKVEPTTVLSEE